MPDRKKLLRQWRVAQKKQYLLDRNEIENLFSWLEERLDACGCDHTLKHTCAWLNCHKLVTSVGDILTEIRDMGGYCDCEVLMNCYEDVFD